MDRGHEDGARADGGAEHQSEYSMGIEGAGFQGMSHEACRRQVASELRWVDESIAQDLRSLQMVETEIEELEDKIAALRALADQIFVKREQAQDYAHELRRQLGCEDGGIAENRGIV